MEKQSVMTFHSTHDALSFESLLKETGLNPHIIQAALQEIQK